VAKGEVARAVDKILGNGQQVDEATEREFQSMLARVVKQLTTIGRVTSRGVSGTFYGVALGALKVVYRLLDEVLAAMGK
jgi:hypothetical protein